MSRGLGWLLYGVNYSKLNYLINYLLHLMILASFSV